MPKLEKNAEEYPRLLDWLRYFCAFMLYMYGISKLLHLQFDMQSQLARQAVGSLTGYQLTLVLLWFLARLRVRSRIGAGVGCDTSALPKNHAPRDTRNVPSDSQHSTHKHVHHGQRLRTVHYLCANLPIVADHPLVSPCRSRFSTLVLPE
jgi:hypothetical protein